MLLFGGGFVQWVTLEVLLINRGLLLLGMVAWVTVHHEGRGE